MTTPQEARRIRLENDYKEMKNIRGNIIQWDSIQGEAPYVEEYRITAKLRTIIGQNVGDRRDEHVLNLHLPSSYPNSPPEISMVTSPPPYHPNWYRNGKWCYGSWEVSEGLGHHVVRMLRTLQFDLEITNPDSPANGDANDWFLAKKGQGLFPCDRTKLPDPTKSRFSIKSSEVKKFSIQ